MFPPFRRSFAAIVASLVVLCAAPTRADTEHRVRSGQTLGVIARRYHVAAAVIARANGLRATSTLRIGQVLVIPTGETVEATRGQTLATIARTHGVTPAELASVNGLRPNARVRAGQRLVIPGGGEGGGTGSDAGWGRPRNPGIVTLQRLGTRESYRGRLVDSRGRANANARRQLTRLMRDDDGRVLAPNPRLLQTLVRVSDHFGGRRIHIVSGFRRPGGYTRDTSRHTQGAAMDIRIEGVPITAIRDYCRSLSNTGCGYYPRSRFVHVDTRDHSEYWIDWSGPGQAPQYSRPNGAPDSDGDGTEAESGATDSDGAAAAASEGAESSAAPDQP